MKDGTRHFGQSFKATRSARDVYELLETIQQEGTRLDVKMISMAVSALSRMRGEWESAVGIVDEHIHGAIGGARRLQQLLAAFFLGNVAGYRRRFSAGVLNALHSALQRPFQHMVTFIQGARGADNLSSLSGKCLGDCLTDAAARPRHYHMPTVKLTHMSHLQSVSHVLE